MILDFSKQKIQLMSVSFTLKGTNSNIYTNFINSHKLFYIFYSVCNKFQGNFR